MLLLMLLMLLMVLLELLLLLVLEWCRRWPREHLHPGEVRRRWSLLRVLAVRARGLAVALLLELMLQCLPWPTGERGALLPPALRVTVLLTVLLLLLNPPRRRRQRGRHIGRRGRRRQGPPLAVTVDLSFQPFDTVLKGYGPPLGVDGPDKAIPTFLLAVDHTGPVGDGRFEVSDRCD